MTTDSTLPNPPQTDQLRATGIRDGELTIVETSEIWWRVHVGVQAAVTRPAVHG
jgi:hypothetical protein